MKINNIYNRLKEENFRYLLILISILSSYFLKFFKPKFFYFDNKRYSYYNGRYTFSWRTERTIEIPIVMEFINKNSHKDLLEIGNVIGHHFTFPHDIIDKYEVAKGVINKDVVDFKLNKKYDLIFSVSTMEHVGWDEDVKDPDKIEKSILNLKKHLKKDGKIIITVPTGYNPNLDKLFSRPEIFKKCYFFKRGIFNTWRQTSLDKIKKYRYGLDRANAMAVIFIA